MARYGDIIANFHKEVGAITGDTLYHQLAEYAKNMNYKEELVEIIRNGSVLTYSIEQAHADHPILHMSVRLNGDPSYKSPEQKQFVKPIVIRPEEGK